MEEGTVILDVGGGGGEYVVAEAKKHPEKKYLLLEPEMMYGEKWPDNVFRVRWKSDVDSGLPLGNKLVDEVHISFLMGEIRTKEGCGGTVEEAIKIYSKITGELRQVLKPGGKVVIVEPQGNIGAIRKKLEEQGYRVGNPEKMTDKTYSRWTEVFWQVFERGGMPEEKSVALPMVVVAFV